MRDIGITCLPSGVVREFRVAIPQTPTWRAPRRVASTITHLPFFAILCGENFGLMTMPRGSVGYDSGKREGRRENFSVFFGLPRAISRTGHLVFLTTGGARPADFATLPTRATAGSGGRDRVAKIFATRRHPLVTITEHATGGPLHDTTENIVDHRACPLLADCTTGRARRNKPNERKIVNRRGRVAGCLQRKAVLWYIGGVGKIECLNQEQSLVVLQRD